jgi:hypothetical protein
MMTVLQARPDAAVINPPDPDFGVALANYLKQFDYRVNVKLGSTYTREYNDFLDWCRARLGQQYKDWFIYSLGKGKYCVFIRESKWATFLALTWVDMLD